MKHDIREELRSYEQITGTQEQFFLTDLAQLYDGARNANGDINTVKAISDALKVGYSIGYKAGIADR